MLKRLLAGITVLGLASIAGADEIPSAVGPGVPAFKVRPGYRVTLVADHLQQARFLEFGEGTTLYVSEPDQNKILCLRDPDADGKYKTVTTFVSGHEGDRLVHGLCWHGGSLWYTGTDSVHKATSTKNDGKADQIDDIDCGPLPGGGGHWYRSILVDDDGFYTSIGDSGNINDHTNDDAKRSGTTTWTDRAKSCSARASATPKSCGTGRALKSCGAATTARIISAARAVKRSPI